MVYSVTLGSAAAHHTERLPEVPEQAAGQDLPDGKAKLFKNGELDASSS